MGWYCDFYKIYRTKQEDVDRWNNRSYDELPEHLQFLCKDYDYEDERGIEEISEYLLPINMYVDGCINQGFLATMYSVVRFGKSSFEIEYKVPRSCWYHFVKLTNSKARELIKFLFKRDIFNNNKEEYLKGCLGKRNQYKHYPGKLRNVVLYYHQ